MAESTLIDATAFREFTSTDRSIKDKNIANAILEGQRGLIKRRFGKPLYDKITGDIDSNPTPNVRGTGLDGIYKQIVDGDGMAAELLIALAEYQLLKDRYSLVRGGGFVRGTSNPSQTLGSQAEYNAKLDQLEQKIDRYDKIMTEFLIANQGDIPELSEPVTISSNAPDLQRSTPSKTIFGGSKRGIRSLTDNNSGITIYEEPRSKYRR